MTHSYVYVHNAGECIPQLTKISMWNELVREKAIWLYHLQEIAIKKMEQKCAANLSVQQKKKKVKRVEDTFMIFY